MKKRKHPKKLSEDQKRFADELFESTKGSVRFVISRVLGSKYAYLLNDCLGELALLVCSKIEELQKHPQPRAWVYVAARNIAHKQMKKDAKFQSSVSIEETDQRLKYTDPGFEEVLYSAEIDQCVKPFLTGREYQVFCKLFKDENDIKTVSEELGISESTVRVLKKTLTDKLKKLF